MSVKSELYVIMELVIQRPHEKKRPKKVSIGHSYNIRRIHSTYVSLRLFTALDDWLISKGPPQLAF